MAETGKDRLPSSTQTASTAPKARGLPRLPLPAKLFLSYILVLAIAAVPSFIYVRAGLARDLVELASNQLLDSARRSAAALSPLSPEQRVERVRDLARMIADRVTLLSPSGEVLFDSDIAEPALALNHRDRSEVKAALTGQDGIAERKSATTGKDTLYVAVRVVGPRDDVVGVLRIARPSDKVHAATAGLTAFARNVQAAAISVAFGLSLLAAVQFLRPLQRVTAAARALASGDLSARSGIASNDEVGDAGKAIDTIAGELRRRLAFAGSGDAVISQLVDALAVPCIVFEVTGEVLALNGAARKAFRVDGPNASRRLKEMTASPIFERALEQAEHDGEPEALDVEVSASERVPAHVHVLKRPGMAPFYVLLGAETPADEATTLPPIENVRPRSFADVFQEARGDASAALLRSGVQIEIAEPPNVLVVDVGHRLPRAVAAVLEGCALAMAGRSATLCMAVKIEDTRVKLKMEADCGPLALERARPLLEPIGGAVGIESGEAALWLPRA